MENEVEQYARLRQQYVAFTDRTNTLISELLRIDQIKTHLIEGRTKTVESFREKIRRPGKSYAKPLEELSDLSGIRVIVYYFDDVHKVAELLKKEFTIIESETSHMASEYSPDQFGYISLHFVVSLSSKRAKLPEWKLYENYRAEIQIRTVLQHGWAAVSHTLQYKNESDVPKQLRRKLNRLAGLFELADEEFISVRDATEQLRNEASSALDHGDSKISLNPISLSEFLQRWKKLDEVKKLMVSLGYSFDDPFRGREDNKDYLGAVSLACEKIGIQTVQNFEETIDYDAKYFLGKIKGDNGDWYVSESFILYLLLIGARPEYFSIQELVAAGWGEEVASMVINIAKEL